MRARAACVGIPSEISRSKRPARRSAASSESGRLVAPAHMRVWSDTAWEPWQMPSRNHT